MQREISLIDVITHTWESVKIQKQFIETVEKICMKMCSSLMRMKKIKERRKKRSRIERTALRKIYFKWTIKVW